MLSSLFFCLLLSSLHASPPVPAFISLGQSNMAGRATVHSWDTGVVPGILLAGPGVSMVSFQNPLNLYSNIRSKDPVKQRLGPSYTFSKYLKFNTTGPFSSADFALIENAKGETSITCWTKGSTCYDMSVSRIHAFLKSANYELKGILWHQGENDFNSTTYVSQLSQTVSNLRLDLNSPTLPFVAGELGQFNPLFTAFNERLQDLTRVIQHSALVSSDGLKDRGDKIHFDWESQHTFGVRYAQAMLKLLA